MLKTKMTEILGIKYPIQCGTMQSITTSELVAPVANAGGLCCIPAAMFQTREAFMDEIKKTRDMTDQPFGVNVGLFPEMTTTVTAQERIDWVIESGVKILETAGRSPQPYREQIAAGGLIHIHKCARVRDAAKVDKIGVDIVSIVGTECGGHPSMEEVSTLVLIPAALDQIKSPLIAGGGFGDGKGLLAGLALGAAGVNMGTRFMATKECPIHENIKQKLVDSIESETALVMKSLMNPLRVLKTPGAEKVLELEAKGATLEELAPYISGSASADGWNKGILDKGMYSSGQIVGRIHDIPTVAQLMERIITQAIEAKKTLDAFF
ncbi:MAG: nitronate monooxygenase family protein [Proteobacteria bacterium]|nr:nitronate monooxygenase family protein [Pseudomonadota bacterium]MBU4470802.1 nitronate monooxygenase family protein [Pseudomonadota bacterium]MCG2751470.1 nitronate monooxygenase family protein [Desulfobacteraceae bacterium]